MKRPRKSKKKLCKNQRFIQSKEQKEWLKKDDEREIPKWVTHYRSDHQILLVGDGDFSFSLSLAKAFTSASNIVSSSLDTYDEVIKKYKKAKSNLDELQKLGAYLLHGVDATKMKFHPDLKMRRFDRIIFNFPHAGFHRKEDNMFMIKMHMDLVFGFFKNASHMLRANGEIHVNHKTTPPFDKWNIEKLAEKSLLIMIECSEFKKKHYPGYNNKRGHSYRCDDPFHLGKCSTFKFINNPRKSMKTHMEVRQQMIGNMDRVPAPLDLNHKPRLLSHDIHNVSRFPAPVDLSYHPQTRNPFEKTQHKEQFPAQVNLNYHRQTRLIPRLIQPDYYPCRSNLPNMNEPTRSEFDLRNDYSTISRDYIKNETEIHGRVASSADCYHYARDMTQDTRRRTIDIVPSKSFSARNEGYQYQTVERSARYLLEDVAHNDERPSYCFDWTRLRYLKRCNAEVHRKSVNSKIYVMQ